MSVEFPIQIYGRSHGFIRVEQGATNGAILGTNLVDTNGDLVVLGGAGTVTSVDVADSPGLTWTGGPITGAGTFTPALSANLVAWSGLAPSSKQDTLGFTPYSAANPAGYTANSSDAALRDRTTHTGTQAVDTITGLGTAATTSASAYATAAQGALADATGADSGWIAPSLLNGWVNLGLPFALAGYRKVGSRVEIRGTLASGTYTGGTSIFILPAGYYPTSHRIFSAQANGGTARVDVRNDGAVQIAVPAGTNAYLAIEFNFQVD